MNRVNRFTAALVIVCMVTAPLAGAAGAPPLPPSNPEIARFCGKLAKVFEAQSKTLKTKLPATQVDDAVAKAIRDCPIDMAEVDESPGASATPYEYYVLYSGALLAQKLVRLSKDIASEVREKQALDLMQPTEPEARPSGYRLNAQSEQLGAKITEDLILAKKLVLRLALFNEQANKIEAVDATNGAKVMALLAAFSALSLIATKVNSAPSFVVAAFAVLTTSFVGVSYGLWRSRRPAHLLDYLAAHTDRHTDPAAAQEVVSVLSAIAFAHGCRPKEMKKVRVAPSIDTDLTPRTRVQTQVRVPEPVMEEFEGADPVEANAATKAKALPLPRR